MKRLALAALAVPCLLVACGGGPPVSRAPAPVVVPVEPAAPPAIDLGPVRASRVNGTLLAYRLVGDSGTPVVFVHGSLGDLDDWNAQIAAFARTHRVLVYSRRYHPPNPQEDDHQPYTPTLHSEDLAALLLALDLAPAHVIGSSYGAYTALILALEHPELVRSVVLGEPPIMPLLTRTPESDSLRRAFFVSALDPARRAFADGDSVRAVRAYFDGVSGVPGRFDRLPAGARAHALAHAYELSREIMTSREEYFPMLRCADLGRLHTPALLLTGDRSTRVLRTIMDELARCLRTDTTAIVPGAGHRMHADNPAFYNRAVLRYVDTH